MAAVTRRQYKGAAAQTTITNALGTGDTSITIAATTGWPSAAEPFFVVISPGTASEEKCLATISGSTLTLTRAQDDTTAQSHSSGAAIYPVFTATDADEANKLAATLTTRGDLLTMGSGPDFARLAVGGKGTIVVSDGTDPSWLTAGTNDYVLTADSGETKGVKWVAPWASVQPVETKTAAYTIVAGDVGKIIRMNATANFTVDSSTGFLVGQKVDVFRIGAGACDVVQGSGATVSGTPGLKLRAQFSAASIVCVASNVYYVVGDLDV